MTPSTFLRYWRWGNTISCLGVLQFVCLSGLAMACYPGGTSTTARTQGYRFTENYLSDLGRTVALSGQSNATASALFNTSVVLLGVSIIPFFLFLPTHAPDQALLLLGAAVFGVISAIGLAGVGLTPYNLRPEDHERALFCWIAPLLVAVTLHAVALYLSDEHVEFFAMLSLGLAILMAAYLFHCMVVAVGATSGGQDVPHAQSATAQKHVAIGSILWFFIFSVRMMATSERNLPNMGLQR